MATMCATHYPSNPCQRIWRFATAEFDPEAWQLRVNGVVVEVEPQPLRVLHCLLQNAGKNVTKDELLQAGWNTTHKSDNVLTNAIGKLRQALGEQAGACIETRRGFGYCLVGATGHAATVPSEDGAAGSSGPGPNVTDADTQSGWPMAARGSVAAVAVIAILALAGIVRWQGAGQTPAIPESSEGVETQSIDRRYQQLSDRELAEPLVGTTVEFTAVYLGLFTHRNLYAGSGFDTDGNIYLQHRPPGYQSGSTPFGSSDLALPPFAIEWPASEVATLNELRKYQTIRVEGVVHLTPHTDTHVPAGSFAEVRIAAKRIRAE